MLLAIISIICTVLISWYLAHEEGENIKGFIVNCALVGIVFGIIYGVIWMTLSMITVDTGKVKEEFLYNISGLENHIVSEQYIDGTFILGCGGINGGTNSKMTYCYFKENEYGKTLESLNCINSNVYIKEDNDKEPCLIQVYSVQRSIWLYDILFKKEEKLIEKCKVLVVPEGTVKIDYNVEV